MGLLLPDEPFDFPDEEDILLMRSQARECASECDEDRRRFRGAAEVMDGDSQDCLSSALGRDELCFNVIGGGWEMVTVGMGRGCGVGL